MCDKHNAEHKEKRKIFCDVINKILNDDDLTFEIEKGIFEKSVCDYNDEYKNYKLLEFDVIYANYTDIIKTVISDNRSVNILDFIKKNIITGYMLAFLTETQIDLLLSYNFAKLSECDNNNIYDCITWVECGTNNGKKLKNRYIDMIDLKQRMVVLLSLIKILGNIDFAVKLEYGFFESTIIYSEEKKIDEVLIQKVYVDKYNQMEEMLNPESKLYSGTLIALINTKGYNIQGIPFLNPYELDVCSWKEIKEKIEYKNYIKNNHETTDMYKCPKCGERKATVMLLQTRGADEPITTFITCQVCGFIRKK